jgi:hypothetical protein
VEELAIPVADRLQPLQGLPVDISARDRTQVVPLHDCILGSIYQAAEMAVYIDEEVTE